MTLSLIERHEFGSTWQREKGKYLYTTGKEINAQPFTNPADDKWYPQDLLLSNAVNTGGGKAIYNGRFGYFTRLDKGFIRVYPVQGNTDKYIEVGTPNGEPLTPFQAADDRIELYYEHPVQPVRLSFFITPRGLKINIEVREGYTGNGQFSIMFNFVGLDRNGYGIYDGSNLLCKLPNTFATDAAGKVYPVSENINAGVAILGVNISNPVFPIIIDPGVEIVNPTKDTYLNVAAPTTGYGQSAAVYLCPQPACRALLSFDLSPIPTPAIVDYATLNVVFWFFSNPLYKIANTIYRNTLYDWQDDSGAGATANWNNYKDGEPWPNGAGGFNDVDLTVKDVLDGNDFVFRDYCSLSVPNNTQDALDNHGKIFNGFWRFDDENQTTSTYFISSENVSSQYWPYLEVGYTEVAIKGFPKGMIVNSHGSRGQHKGGLVNA